MQWLSPPSCQQAETLANERNCPKAEVQSWFLWGQSWSLCCRGEQQPSGAAQCVNNSCICFSESWRSPSIQHPNVVYFLGLRPLEGEEGWGRAVKLHQPLAERLRGPGELMTFTRQQKPLQGEHRDGDKSWSQSFLWMPSTWGKRKYWLW